MGDNSGAQQPKTNQNSTTKGSGSRKHEAEASAGTIARGAEAPVDRMQWSNKMQHNNQPDDKRDVARGGSAMRDSERQRLGVCACCWCRTTVVRRQPLLLKWKGAEAFEIVLNADIDNNV